MSRWIAIVLGAWMICAVAVAAPVEGPTGVEPSQERGLGSGLVVVVDPEVSDAQMVRDWVATRGDEVIAEMGESLDVEDLIRITVKGGSYDYRVRVVVRRRGRILAEQPGDIACECGSDEMLDRVGGAIGQGVEALRAEKQAEKARALAWARQEALEREAGGGAGALGKGLTSLGYSGIGVAVVGAVGLAVGIPLSVRPPDDIRGTPSAEEIELRSTRPIGIGMAVVGSVALAGGVMMLLVDRVRVRRGTLAATPTLGPGLVGIAVRRNF